MRIYLIISWRLKNDLFLTLTAIDRYFSRIYMIGNKSLHLIFLFRLCLENWVILSILGFFFRNNYICIVVFGFFLLFFMKYVIKYILFFSSKKMRLRNVSLEKIQIIRLIYRFNSLWNDFFSCLFVGLLSQMFMTFL